MGKFWAGQLPGPQTHGFWCKREATSVIVSTHTVFGEDVLVRAQREKMKSGHLKCGQQEHRDMPK